MRVMATVNVDQVWENEAAERATNSPGCDTPSAAKPKGGADLMVAHTQSPIQTARGRI